MSIRVLKDGTKIELGFAFEGMEPVVKTDPSFTTRKTLTGKDWMILRYAAMNIISRIDASFYTEIKPDWYSIDHNNFVASDTLVLNNGYGVLCYNGDTMTHLYLAPGGQIMALVEDADNEIYDVLIS